MYVSKKNSAVKDKKEFDTKFNKKEEILGFLKEQQLVPAAETSLISVMEKELQMIHGRGLVLHFSPAQSSSRNSWKVQDLKFSYALSELLMNEILELYHI